MLERIKIFGIGVWSFCFLALPFNVSFFSLKSEILSSFWSNFLQSLPFNLTSEETMLYSDSFGFMVSFVITVGLSLVLFSLLSKNGFIFKDIISNRLVKLFDMCMLVIFMKYGIDKLMMLQFPPPEINLMYTPLGEFDKDILFWSAIGSSPAFNYILGGIEALGAACLLFPRLNLFGRIILWASSIAILCINLSFGIGVKLFLGIFVYWLDHKEPSKSSFLTGLFLLF